MIRKLTTLVLVALLLSFKSFAFDFPKDLPTFEALMALHKAVKKDEDQALGPPQIVPCPRAGGA